MNSSSSVKGVLTADIVVYDEWADSLPPLFWPLDAPNSILLRVGLVWRCVSSEYNRKATSSHTEHKWRYYELRDVCEADKQDQRKLVCLVVLPIEPETVAAISICSNECFRH